MGRLENIIERNQRPGAYREKLIVWLPLGVIGIVLLALTVCTDLGMPPVPERAPPEQPTRVDGVLLGRPGTPARKPDASPPAVPSR